MYNFPNNRFRYKDITHVAGQFSNPTRFGHDDDLKYFDYSWG